MTNFLKINKDKILFVFKITSLAFTILVSVILMIIGLIKSEYPSLLLFLKVLIFTAIIFPISIIGIAYIEWISKRRVRDNAFNQKPFNRLDTIGFTTSYLYEKSKWHFTEETKELILHDYIIQCDIRRESPNTVEFKAFVKYPDLDEEKFKKLQDKFGRQEIHFDNDGLIKIYKITKPMNLTIEQLKTDLNQFVQELKQEAFEPDEK